MLIYGTLIHTTFLLKTIILAYILEFTFVAVS